MGPITVCAPGITLTVPCLVSLLRASSAHVCPAAAVFLGVAQLLALNALHWSGDIQIDQLVVPVCDPYSLRWCRFVESEDVPVSVHKRAVHASLHSFYLCDTLVTEYFFQLLNRARREGLTEDSALALV